MENKLCFLAKAEDMGLRIDKFLADKLPECSRSFLQKLIKEQNVQVNKLPVKSNYPLRNRDEITLFIPEAIEPSIQPEDIELNICYEDKDIIIVNKPKGMVVHPGAGHYTGTLVNGLLFHCKGQLSGINGVLRPGIVHRIDRDTTGLIVVCKNDYAHQFVADQLKNHTITRMYHAIVHGCFNNAAGTIEAPIGRHQNDRKKMAVNYRNGKPAITHYKVLQELRNFTYIECQLETGRTHQIRVHMSSIHHPLLGDETYGSRTAGFSLNGQTLHAMTLGFIHPSTKKYIEFSAPLPEYFMGLLRELS